MSGGGNRAQPGKIVLDHVTKLLAHALALEVEAVERYADLAEQMENHNNLDVAKLFMKMSEIEKLHVQQIRDMIAEHGAADIPPRSYRWLSPEGPETTNPEDMHYLMTPHHALNLAMYNEQRACEYYANIAANTDDEETRKLAQELSEEEEEHVALVKVWLDRYPPPDEDWDYDDDPPFLQD